MNLIDFGGEISTSTESELVARLGVRYGNQANDFILTHDGKKYPFLEILVKANLAYVHYFPNDTHPGFRSDGIKSHTPGDFIKFYTGTPIQETEVLSDAVVPVEDAIKTALEFANTDKLPSTIRWFEL